MLDWLIYGDLAPTGNRVYLHSDPAPPPEFPGYRPYWVQSGTAALALALMIARNGKPQEKSPSVLLPAYGCPDLVAAAQFAGVRPILVDIGASDPGYCLDQLAQALDASTVAVVAVNFLGIRERLGEIRKLLEPHAGVLLIEDNAQWLPEPPNTSAARGDLVCLSFGRGKPVSLLGGGALLIPESGVVESLPNIDPGQSPGAQLWPKALAFNALLNPRLYWIVNRNPLIKLGRTVFKPLTDLRTMDTARLNSLAPAINHYLHSGRHIEELWAKAVPLMPGLLDLSVAIERKGRLLRYPLLCPTAEIRDHLWHTLRNAGLGVTAMYQCALPEIEGVGTKAKLFGDCSAARSFAGRLLTLPVHEKVSAAHVQRAVELISRMAT